MVDWTKPFELLARWIISWSLKWQMMITRLFSTSSRNVNVSMAITLHWGYTNLIRTYFSVRFLVGSLQFLVLTPHFRPRGHSAYKSTNGTRDWRTINIGWKACWWSSMGRSKSRRCNGISVLSQFLGGQLGLCNLIPANLIYCMFLTSTKTCMGMRHDFHSME